MDLKTLNKNSFIQKKPVAKLNTLAIDEKIKTKSAKIVRTKYGNTVVLELEESVVFLPKRVTETYSVFVEYFSNEQYYHIFKGEIDLGKPRTPLSFEIVQ